MLQKKIIYNIQTNATRRAGRTFFREEISLVSSLKLGPFWNRSGTDQNWTYFLQVPWKSDIRFARRTILNFYMQRVRKELADNEKLNCKA